MMPPVNLFLGTVPEAMQFDTWSDSSIQQTDPQTWREDGSCFLTVKSQTAAGKAVQQCARDGPHRHHPLVPALLRAVARLE